MKLAGVCLMMVCVMCATSAFGDYILRDLVGDGATDGFAPNVETRYPGSLQDFLDGLESGVTVVDVGGGRYDLYENGILEGYVIDLGSDGLAPAEGEAVIPSEGVGINVSSFVRGTVLRQSTAARGEEGTRVGRNGAFRADIYYNTFEAGPTEGTTIGLTPAIMFGDTVEFAVRLPLQMTEIDGVDQSLYHYGADVSLTINISDYFAIGAHGAYSRNQWEDGDSDDATGMINGGPYVSVVIPMGEASLTLGALYEYVTPEDSEDGDDTTFIVGGANLGLPLGGSVGVNVYGMHYYHTDSDLSDFNFTDAGAELAMMLGETWAVQVGGRTVLGRDDIDSVEAYLGSEWAF
jgi:hypothetical protein